MSWNKWRAGLIVSLVSGLLTGIIGLTLDISNKALVILLLVQMAKDGLLYITNHPVDSIEDTDPDPPR